MIEVRKTEVFAKWLDALKDIRARARILVRIERLASGNPGDVKSVGGDKRTQAKDIKTAMRLAQNL